VAFEDLVDNFFAGGINENLFDSRLLYLPLFSVRDREIIFETDYLAVFTKQESTNGVKRSYISVSLESHPYEDVHISTQIKRLRSIAEQCMQTAAHLVGSLICEGDGDDLGWWYVVMENEMCYSTCECACLSTPGSCEYLQGDFRRMDDS
jgi:hypothetical protein